MKSDYNLNLTYKFHALQNLQITFSREKFEPGPEFEQRYGNLDSSMVKSARLEIWRSVVQIPVQVQIFLLKI